MKCIYAIINLKNGKKYIGSTTNFSRRKKGHLYKLRKNKHHSKSLQHSYTKHGEDFFKFIILKTIPLQEDMFIEEQKYIDKFKSADRKFGYNMLRIVNDPGSSIVHKKVYQYSFDGKLIKIFDDCTQAADEAKCDNSGLSKCARGKYRYYGGFVWIYEDALDTLEDRLYLANNKPKVSSKTRKKMRNKKLGLYLKPIIQYSLDDEFIKEWGSTTELCKEKGYSNGYISDCLNGKHEKAYGYKWKFKNEK